MTTVTLADVQAQQAKLTAMLAELVASATTTLVFPEAAIQLQPGEQYAGLVLGANGLPSHHLILLPGEATDLSWQAAMAWAENAGAALPTRQEQALLYANLKGQFQPAWYWSNQKHDTDGSFAWSQNFYDGTQLSSHKSFEGRARAVRRFAA